MANESSVLLRQSTCSFALICYTTFINYLILTVFCYAITLHLDQKFYNNKILIISQDQYSFGITGDTWQ